MPSLLLPSCAPQQARIAANVRAGQPDRPVRGELFIVEIRVEIHRTSDLYPRGMTSALRVAVSALQLGAAADQLVGDVCAHMSESGPLEQG
mgnify:CR=1 FL=1